MSDTTHSVSSLMPVTSTAHGSASTTVQANSIPMGATVPISLPAAVTASSSSSSLSHASSAMNFEVVTTVAQQQQGLGGRAIIPDNYAMLFVFPIDESMGFWMKDMLTSIDMIWLSDDGTIVSIKGSVAPNTYPDVFYPPVPVKYVLETRAGFAMEKNWHIGTQVLLPLPY